MADNINTVSNVNTGSFLNPEIWAKDILFANMPNFIFMQFSSKAVESNGHTIRWAVAGTLNPGGTLHEGTQINAGTLTIAQITMTPQEHGNALTWSGVLDTNSFTDMRNNIGYRMIRDDFAQYMDKLAYNALKAGTWFVGGGTFGTAVPAAFGGTVAAAQYKISADVLLETVQQMKLRKVPTFDNGRYVAVLSVQQMTDLYKDGTFREVQRYAEPMTLINGAEKRPVYGWRGAYAGMDLIETTELTTTALTFGTSGTVTAYQAIALGKEAFGDGWAVPLELTYYDDATLDAKRVKKLTWYALGNVKVLKPQNVSVIRTA